jgi:hypothetical protein
MVAMLIVTCLLRADEAGALHSEADLNAGVCWRPRRRDRRRRKGSKVHIAVNSLSHLLAQKVIPANQGDRPMWKPWPKTCRSSPEARSKCPTLSRGYTGPNAARAARAVQKHGIELEVSKHPLAQRRFVLLSHRWVIQRSFTSAASFRRLARGYERLDPILKGLHHLSSTRLMIAKVFTQLA